MNVDIEHVSQVGNAKRRGYLWETVWLAETVEGKNQTLGADVEHI